MTSKKIKALIASITLSLLTTQLIGQNSVTNEKPVLIVIAQHDYQPTEFGATKNALKQAGYTIVVASNERGTAYATDKSSMHADTAISDARASDYQAIILIGGSGAMKYLDNKATYQLIQNAYKQQSVVGAICLTTRVLAKSNVAQGKSATGWDGDNALEKLYQKYGIAYARQDIIVDGNIVTATDSSTAKKFGQALVSVIQPQKNRGK